MALTKVSAALADLDGAVVINESSADVDFRIESDDSTHMLFVDGGNDRVGIKQSSPLYELDVNGEAYIRTRLFAGDGTASSPSVRFFNASTGIYHPGSDALGFTASGSERMRITDNNVFLNQTATADSGVADGRLEITRGSQHCLNCHVAGTGNSTLVAFINDNGFVGGINTNGSATAFNTSSDARLKNILGEAKGLEVVNALNPVNFEWKSDGKIQDGLIAQEVEKVYPEAVSEPELDGEWYSVDYSKLVTPLIKAIQEQQIQIEALQSEINTLKGE